MKVKDMSKYVGFYVGDETYAGLRELADRENCVTVNRYMRELIEREIREHSKNRRSG